MRTAGNIGARLDDRGALPRDAYRYMGAFCGPMRPVARDQTRLPSLCWPICATCESRGRIYADFLNSVIGGAPRPALSPT